MGEEDLYLITASFLFLLLIGQTSPYSPVEVPGRHRRLYLSVTTIFLGPFDLFHLTWFPTYVWVLFVATPAHSAV